MLRCYTALSARAVPVSARAVLTRRWKYGGGAGGSGDGGGASPSPSPSPSPSEDDDATAAANAAVGITWKGMGLNAFLSGSKFTAGIASNSPALVSDAAHSLSDIATDLVTLYTHKLSREPADWEHPFGHGKFESVGTAAVGGVLVATGLGVGYNSLLSMQDMLWTTSTATASGAPFVDGGSGGALAHVPPDLAAYASPGTAMAVALASVLLKEAMYRFTLRAGEAANSRVVIANAHHHRSDALSSLVALAGIAGGVVCDAPWLDPVAGLLVAGMILQTGAGIGADSMRDLVDTNIPAEYISEIAHACTSVPGVTLNVRTKKSLRARRMGPHLLVDVSITVDGALSCSSAHQLGEHVRRNVMRRVPSATDVTVHIDPSDREEYHPAANPCLLRTPDVWDTRIRALLRRRCPDVLGVADVLLIYKRERRLFVKVDVLLRPDLTIGAANGIAATVRGVLMEDMPEIDGVDVDLELSEMPASDKQVMLIGPEKR